MQLQGQTPQKGPAVEMEPDREEPKKANQAWITFLVAVMMVLTGSVNTLAARMADLVRFESDSCVDTFDWPSHDHGSEIGASNRSDWKPTYLWPNDAMCAGSQPDDPPMSGSVALSSGMELDPMRWSRFEPDTSKDGIESDGKSLRVNFEIKLHPGRWLAVAWCQCGGDKRDDTKPYQCDNVQDCDLSGGDVFVGFVNPNKTCGSMDLTVTSNGTVEKDSDSGCTDDVRMPFAGCQEGSDGLVSLSLYRNAETQDTRCDQRLPHHGFFAYATGSCSATTGCMPRDKNDFAARTGRVRLLSEDAYGTVCPKEDFRCSFNHPFFQADLMFFGEFLCLIVYFILCKVHNPGSEGHPGTPGPEFKIYLFALPALCDMCATGLMYVGLTLIYSSIFQMLRGSVIIFTMMFSYIFFGRRPYKFQYVAVVLILLGLSIVGIAAFIGHGSGCGAGDNISQTILGCALILAGQMFAAFQMVVEEKFLGEHNVPALLAVGLEGVYGMLFMSLVIIPMHFIPTPFAESSTRSWPTQYLEDVPSAFRQISCNPIVIVPLLGTSLSVAFFNFAGVTITKRVSATIRMVLDSVRTIVIWAVSLMLHPVLDGMQGFDKLTFGWQAFGFVVLIMGIALYNRIFKIAGLDPPYEGHVPDQTELQRERKEKLVFLATKLGLSQEEEEALAKVAGEDEGVYVKEIVDWIQDHRPADYESEGEDEARTPLIGRAVSGNLSVHSHRSGRSSLVGLGKLSR